MRIHMKVYPSLNFTIVLSVEFLIWNLRTHMKVYPFLKFRNVLSVENLWSKSAAWESTWKCTLLWNSPMFFLWNILIWNLMTHMKVYPFFKFRNVLSVENLWSKSGFLNLKPEDAHESLPCFEIQKCTFCGKSLKLNEVRWGGEIQPPSKVLNWGGGGISSTL